MSLDEQFLVHSAVHKAVIRLLRTCAGDELQERIDGRNKAMGAAGNIARPAPSEYEEDCAYGVNASTVSNPRLVQWWTCSASFAVEYERTETCS